MEVALSCLALIGYALLFSRKGIVPDLAAPFVVSCQITLVLFLAALVDQLETTVLILRILGVVALVVHFRSSNTSHQKISWFANNWILEIFATWMIASYIVRTKEFVLWDEFSVWGPNARVLIETNEMWSGTNVLTTNFYPPAIQLVSYFFLQGSQWSEGPALLVNFALIVAGILAVFSLSEGSTKHWRLGVLIGFLGFICSGIPLVTVTADAVLSVAFATSLAIACWDNLYKFHSLTLSCVLGFIALTKPIGWFFCMPALFCFGLMLLRRSNLRGWIAAGRKLIIIALVPVLCIAIFNFDAVEAGKATRPTFFGNDFENSSIDELPNMVRRIFDFMTIPVFPRWELTPWHSNSNVQIWRLSLFQIALLMTLVAALVVVCSGRRNLWKLLPLLMYSVGLFLYVGILGVAYVTTFSRLEQDNLASLDRYLLIYIAAGILFLGSLCLQTEDTQLPMISNTPRFFRRVLNRQSVIRVGFTLLLALMAPAVTYQDPADLQAREEVESFTDQIRRFVNPGQEVYFIDQGSSGRTFYTVRYLLWPNPLQPSCWSIGSPTSPSDKWTCNLELYSTIKKYDILIVYSTDTQLRAKLAQGLADGWRLNNARVFRILTSVSNRLTLSPLDCRAGIVRFCETNVTKLWSLSQAT